MYPQSLPLRVSHDKDNNSSQEPPPSTSNRASDHQLDEMFLYRSGHRLLRPFLASGPASHLHSCLVRENTLPNGCCIPRLMSTEPSLSRSHFQELVFDLYKDEKTNKIYIPNFFKQLFECGIRRDDPRLARMFERVRDVERIDGNGVFEPDNLFLDKEMFKRCVGSSIGVIAKALKKQLVIPDWETFCGTMGEIFEETRKEPGGNVATYIPQLARTDPSYWAMSVCTVDGQRKYWGDATVPFCLQSVSKPFTYAMVHSEIGADELHKYVGQEPSGRLFNDICLDHERYMMPYETGLFEKSHGRVYQFEDQVLSPFQQKPHNPLINAGAIVVASLVMKAATLSDRFDYALRQVKKFGGDGPVGFNNAVFLSERETADRNYALSYYMREHKADKNGLSQDTLDLYFQLCSIETNTDNLAVMAGTLANGGVNPMNGERVINNRACRDTLSLMYSCGMYDWSGQFAFRVGLPAKSGVAGDMIIVVPNVMGICLYSPRLDSLGNTVRGVKFAEQFVKTFNFHNYDSLVYSDTHKLDPRRLVVEQEQENTTRFMYAAKTGDISAIKRYLLLGLNIHERDYDDRTVLHVAASEDNEFVCEYILSKWNESPMPVDRFGRTPLEDAESLNRPKNVELLRKAEEVYQRNMRQSGSSDSISNDVIAQLAKDSGASSMKSIAEESPDHTKHN